MVPKKRLMIILAIVLSYLISGILIAGIRYTDKPEFETEKMRSTLAAIGFSASRIFQTNTSLKSSSSSSVSGFSNSENAAISFSSLPTATPLPFVPTNIPAAVQATTVPTTVPTQASQPTAKPTVKPAPTSPPAPTREPTSALPAGYARPGSSREEILQIAAQKACIPLALLKAFLAQESPGDLNYSDKWAVFYNAYDWWHRVTEQKQVCSGYGYYTETGLIPSDSLFAGQQCKEGARPGDNVSHSMGAGQMLEYYWNKTYKAKTAQALSISNPDRRVILDGLVGFGINIKEGTKAPGGCENWDFKYIIKAACVNTGGGSAYSYYYGIICRNYNKYANQSNNCDNVASMIVPDSSCQLK